MTTPAENPWLTLDERDTGARPQHPGEAIETQARETPPTTPAPPPANPWHGLGRHESTDGSEPPPAPEPEPELPSERNLPDPELAFRSQALGGAGYIAAETRRRERRALERAARERGQAQKQVIMRERKTTMEAEKQARKDARYLPAGGERGTDAGRSLRELRVEPHHATSNVLAVGYPFLAEAGLGSEGALIGHDSWSGAAFCFDVWNLYQRQVVTNPNMLLAGILGRGKSALAKSLATRSIAFGRKVYVPGDPKGEWTRVARAVGGGSIALGPGMTSRINPLDEGPRPRHWVDADGNPEQLTDERWTQIVRTRRQDLVKALTEQAVGRDLQSVELTALSAALDAVTSTQRRPILPQVVHRMMEPTEAVSGSSVQQLRDDGRVAAHALNRVVSGDLSGIFDGESTTPFDTSLPMLTLDMSRMWGNDTLLALAMACASAWMEAALADPAGGQRLCVYDEAWRLMALPTLLARMQSQWKLSRHWGIANLLVIHRLSDLDAVGDSDSSARNLALGLLADTSTRIIYAQERGEAEKTGATIGLTQTEIAQLPDLSLGEGLWRIGDRAFVVSHDLAPGELQVYNTNARMHANDHRFPAVAVAMDQPDATGENG